MFERFTDRARRVVVLAQEEARLLNHAFIGTEHLLLGLIHEGGGVAAQAMQNLGVSLEGMRTQIEASVGMAEPSPSGHIPFTVRAKKVFESALRESLLLGHNYIGTEHLLLGLLREIDGIGAWALRSQGLELHKVRQEVIRLLSGYAEPPPTPPALLKAKGDGTTDDTAAIQAASDRRGPHNYDNRDMRNRIDNDFTYHPPRPDQIPRYEEIREIARGMAHRLIDLTPAGREQSLALSALDEVVSFANAAIARGESTPRNRWS